MFPVLAGRFLTTAPPGKSLFVFLWEGFEHGCSLRGGSCVGEHNKNVGKAEDGIWNLESPFTGSVTGTSYINSLNFCLLIYKIQIISILWNCSKN